MAIDKLTAAVQEAAGRLARAALADNEKDVWLLVHDVALEAVLRATLDHFEGNTTRAARRLGINRTTLLRFRRRFGMMVHKNDRTCGDSDCAVALLPASHVEVAAAMSITPRNALALLYYAKGKGKCRRTERRVPNGNVGRGSHTAPLWEAV